LFQYWSKTSKQTETNQKNFLGCPEKANQITTETDWVSVCFGSNREKKLMVLRTPKLFRDFFGLFRENSVCFGCFDTSPKQLNKPKQTEKNDFWFRETNQKITKTD
jgi:hypothetical protein